MKPYAYSYDSRALSDPFFLIDVMAPVSKISTKVIETFGQFIDSFIRIVDSHCMNAKRVDYAFDQYADGAIKDAACQCRTTKAPIDLAYFDRNTPLPKNMNTFWSSNKNKVKLQILLYECIVMKNRQEASSTITVLSNIEMIPAVLIHFGEIINVPELYSNIDEAGDRLIIHMVHSLQCGHKNAVFLSNDTDVAISVLFHMEVFKTLNCEDVWLKAGVGDTTRYIPMHELCSVIGRYLCDILPAIHSLTGADYTSKVGTKQSSLSYWVWY